MTSTIALSLGTEGSPCTGGSPIAPGSAESHAAQARKMLEAASARITAVHIFATSEIDYKSSR
jgi:hypothetical protein